MTRGVRVSAGWRDPAAGATPHGGSGDTIGGPTDRSPPHPRGRAPPLLAGAAGPPRGGCRGGGPGAGLRDGLRPRRLEVANPSPQRERVVLTQTFDVTRLETGELDARNDTADLVQLTVGEDIPVDEAAPHEPRSGTRQRRSRDAV